MEFPPTEDLLTQPPTYKLYKDGHIGAATFLGGPLIGGYLAAENFKCLNEPRSARNAWIISIIAFVIIFGALFIIPEVKYVPSYLIPLIYSTVTRVLLQKYQGPQLRTHTANGGQFYSIWRAVAISLIGVALILALIIGIMYYADSPSPA